MTHFTISEMFNKAKSGIKLPYVKPADTKLPEGSQGAKHMDYYKNMKEKYRSRQA